MNTDFFSAKLRPLLAFTACGVLAGTAPAGALQAASPVLLDFADLALEPETAYTGEPDGDGFVSNGFHFNNNFTDWGGGFSSWAGFAYSNRTEAEEAGFGSETSAITGGSHSDPDGDGIYVVAYGSAAGESVITFPAKTVGRPLSIQITNTTYAYYSMRDGDDFAKQFGGEDGSEPDFFILTIHGLDHSGDGTGEVEVTLADYRGEENILVDSWIAVDLEALGDTVTALTFSLESSDMGDLGMNTPGYFALDSLSVELSAQIIPGAEKDAETPWKYAWLGWYIDANAPWVFHHPLGWIHWTAETTGNWFYSIEADGWLWTDADAFPAIWREASGDWVLLDSQSEPGALLYFSFSEGEWIEDAPHL